MAKQEIKFKNDCNIFYICFSTVSKARDFNDQVVAFNNPKQTSPPGHFHVGLLNEGQMLPTVPLQWSYLFYTY